MSQYTLKEGHEEIRADAIEVAVKTMKGIMENKDATNQEKIEAARTVDSISDTMIKVQLLSGQAQTAERTTNKLVRQLDRLIDTKED